MVLLISWSGPEVSNALSSEISWGCDKVPWPKPFSASTVGLGTQGLTETARKPPGDPGVSGHRDNKDRVPDARFPLATPLLSLPSVPLLFLSILSFSSTSSASGGASMPLLAFGTRPGCGSEALSQFPQNP